MPNTTFDSNTFLWLLLGAVVSGYAHILFALLLSLLLRLIRSTPSSSQKPPWIRPPTISSLLLVNLTGTRTKAAPASVTKPTVDVVALGGLVTAATWVGGKPQNEDRVSFDDLGAAKLLIVADGVSASDHGPIAAEAVVQCLRQAIRDALADANSRFDQAFFQLACEMAAQRVAAQIPQATSAESTVVVLLELPDRIVLAYLGDGGAVWVRGNQRGGRSLLLAQHDEYGRLSGFVGAEGVTGTPTVLQIQKSAETDGAIFAIGSDGALPRSHEIGRVHQLLQTLLRQVKAGDLRLTPADVAQLIEKCLVDWNPDDNATLGILFTQEALAYWQQQVESNHESIQGGIYDNGKPEHQLALVER